MSVNVVLNNTDNRLNTIYVGSRVVFNKSGELQVGTVVAFKESKSNKTWIQGLGLVPVPVILVMQDGADQPSRVKYSRSVMVINETTEVSE